MKSDTSLKCGKLYGQKRNHKNRMKEPSLIFCYILYQRQASVGYDDKNIYYLNVPLLCSALTTHEIYMCRVQSSGIETINRAATLTLYNELKEFLISNRHFGSTTILY